MIWRGGSGGHRVLGGLGYPALPSCLLSPRLSLARVRQAAASVPRRVEAGGRADCVCLTCMSECVLLLECVTIECVLLLE